MDRRGDGVIVAEPGEDSRTARSTSWRSERSGDRATVAFMDCLLWFGVVAPGEFLRRGCCVWNLGSRRRGVQYESVRLPSVSAFPVASVWNGTTRMKGPSARCGGVLRGRRQGTLERQGAKEPQDLRMRWWQTGLPGTPGPHHKVTIRPNCSWKGCKWAADRVRPPRSGICGQPEITSPPWPRTRSNGNA